jgi:hypothetical protein
MPSKLFRAIVVAGASVTGAIGIATVPAVTTLLSGCDTVGGCHPECGLVGTVEDMSVYGAVDTGLVLPDLATDDAGHE